MFPASPSPPPSRQRSLQKGALSFGVQGEEGAGLRRWKRGRCPAVAVGRGSPRVAGSEVSAGAGFGCGTGRRGRDVGCGFSTAGAGGVGPWRPGGGILRRKGVGVPGSPWICQVCDAVF